MRSSNCDQLPLYLRQSFHVIVTCCRTSPIDAVLVAWRTPALNRFLSAHFVALCQFLATLPTEVLRISRYSSSPHIPGIWFQTRPCLIDLERAHCSMVRRQRQSPNGLAATGGDGRGAGRLHLARHAQDCPRRNQISMAADTFGLDCSTACFLSIGIVKRRAAGLPSPSAQHSFARRATRSPRRSVR